MNRYCLCLFVLAACAASSGDSRPQASKQPKVHDQSNSGGLPAGPAQDTDRWMPNIGIKASDFSKEEILAKRAQTLSVIETDRDPAFELVAEAGAILISKGDPAEAEALCDRALAMNPSVDVTVYFNRSSARAAQGDLDGALEDLSRLLEERPTDAYFGARAGVYERMGLYAEAIEDYDRAIASRDQTLFHARKADACYMAEDYSSALRHYDIAVARYADQKYAKDQHVLALEMRAFVKENLGDTDGAASDRKLAAEARR